MAGTAKPIPKGREEHRITPIIRGMIRGFPEEHIVEFSREPAAIRALEEMLGNATEEAYWLNALVALGQLAPYSEILAGDLIRFAENPGPYQAPKSKKDKKEKITSAAFFAKTRVPLILGHWLRSSGACTTPRETSQVYFVSRPDKVDKVLEYLSNLLDLSDADARSDRNWRSPANFPRGTALSQLLAERAIEGLGVSSCPAGEDILRRRRQRSGSDDPLRGALDRALGAVAEP